MSSTLGIVDQGQGHGATEKLFSIYHNSEYKLSSPKSQLWHILGSCD